MLMDYFLIADSTVGDGVPDDFTISFDRPLYKLESITLLSCKIHIINSLQAESLYIRLSDPYNDTIFKDNIPFQYSQDYSGVVLIPEHDSFIQQNGTDDPLESIMYKGNYPELSALRIQILYYNATPELVPYHDSGGNASQNIFKFKVKCSLDKFNTLVDQPKELGNETLPEPVKLEYLDYPKRVDQKEYYTYAVVATLLLVVFIFTIRSPRTPAGVA